MDTICEQLVKGKNGSKFYLSLIGIVIALLVISYLSLNFLFSFMIIIIPLSLYGAYKLLNYLTVEYEYIIVNGSLDLDIIYGKSSRKRLGSFELSDVESIEKYNGETLDKNRYKKIIIACDAKSDEAYKIVFNKDSAVSIAIMTPNEKTRASIVKFVPKYVGNTAFKS